MEHGAVLYYEDLETFPDDNLRREILGGELHVTPGPVPRHARVTDAIARAVWAYSQKAGGECYGSAVHIVLSAQNVVVPDVVYIAPDRLHTIGKKAVLGIPSLLVEVLSPSTSGIDRVKKRAVYARLGVPEYWIVDPEANTIERCSDPSGDHYCAVETFDKDMPSATLRDLTLSFNEIFR
jgi:Uma2 family endonuclease